MICNANKYCLSIFDETLLNLYYLLITFLLHMI